MESVYLSVVFSAELFVFARVIRYRSERPCISQVNALKHHILNLVGSKLGKYLINLIRHKGLPARLPQGHIVADSSLPGPIFTYWTPLLFSYDQLKTSE